MSCSVYNKCITDENRNTIFEDLSIEKKAKFLQASVPEIINVWSCLDDSLNGTIKLPMNYAMTHFKQHINITDKYYKLSFNNFLGDLREGQQIDVVNKSLEKIIKNGQCLINMNTGAGKTVVGCYIAIKLGLMTIVVHPLKTLNDQWKKTFENMSNLSTWTIDKPTDKVPFIRPDVIICRFSALKAIPKKWIDKTGLLIMDEVHMLCTESAISQLLEITPKYILGETATPSKNTGFVDSIIPLFFGNNIITNRIFKKFTVVKVNTGIIPVGFKTISKRVFGKKIEYPLWDTVIKCLSHDNARNKLLIKMIKIITKMRKTLILTKLTEHAKFIDDSCDFVDHEVYYGTRKDGIRDTPLLIGTDKKLGTGFDEENKSLDKLTDKISVLILPITFDEPSCIEQLFGRAFRGDDPIIFIFVDKMKQIENHWKTTIEWAKKTESANIIEIDNDDKLKINIEKIIN